MIRLKTPFFTPRKLIHTVLIVLMVYVFLWGGVLIKSKLERDHNKRINAAKQTQIKELSKEELAIKKAQDHLMNSISSVDTSERIFFSYLQRKFNLPKVLGAEGPPIDLYEDPRTYPAEIHYLARIAYPDKIVRELPKYELDDGVKVTNIYSANCDHIPLPGNFWQTVEQNISTGSYYVAHVALALEMMKNNGCPLPVNADDISERVAKELSNIAGDANVIADLRYEAVAFLFMTDRNDLVKPEWIDRIISEQREDGSWSKEVGGDRNDPHSTLLALWSLLEYSRPNTPDEPLIRRPDGY